MQVVYRLWPYQLRSERTITFYMCLALAVQFSAPLACAGPDGFVSVPVPQTSIQPGDVIRDSQITEREFDARITKREFFQQTTDVVGKVARRILLPGRPIPLTSLKEAYLVSAGETVTVTFRAEGLEMTGRAVALQSGHKGEVVACRNVDTGVVIRGKVTDTSLVQMDGN